MKLFLKLDDENPDTGIFLNLVLALFYFIVGGMPWVIGVKTMLD